MDSIAPFENSHILIVTICSNSKLTSGETIKNELNNGIIKFLPDRLISPLYGARYNVRTLITSGSVSRDGKPLRELPFNDRLVDGHDFRGNKSGLYMPAIQRYNGRFFKSLGTEPERAELASHLKHHLLIISGLYGMLTPSELIQCYSCHVPDHPNIAKYWTENDLLTELLLAYAKRFNIKKIFDFMAVDSYRNLISWESIRHVTQNNVLHCYSEQFAGDAFLPSLGFLTKEFLTEYSEENLIGLAPNEKMEIPNDKITFLSSPKPTPSLAREIHKQQAIIDINDKIGRVRRNYIKILRSVLGSEYDEAGFGRNIGKLRRRVGHHESEIPEKLEYFNDVRKKVEYHNTNGLYEWETLLEDYIIILNWAERKHYIGSIRLEMVE